jgi:hypothetical protein
MARQMTMTLTEQEYATLAEKAAQKGKKPETLLYEMMQEMLQAGTAKHPLTEQEFEEKLYLEGLIENIPARQPLTPEELAERERLGRLYAGGKLMSEMVIEDRGPY